MGDEFATLRESLKRMNEMPRRQHSGDLPKDLLEAPLREFLAHGAPTGLTVGKGWRSQDDSRPQQDMDIVFDDATADWHAGVRMYLEDAAVHVHIELAYRCQWDASKLRQDLTRLQQTVETSRTLGRKTWTALVLFGDVSVPFATLAREIHEFYHSAPPVQWDSQPLGTVWSHVDAVALPGLFCRKHDLFTGTTTNTPTSPGMVRFPIAGSCPEPQLQSLVPLRGCLHSFLGKVTGQKERHAPTWERRLDPVFMGGELTQADAKRFLDGPLAVTFDAAPKDILWDHYNRDQQDHHVVYARHLGETCSAQHGFLYLAGGGR